jgi:outer membrane protein OmpA-like peptidoglycan-associated protein
MKRLSRLAGLAAVALAFAGPAQAQSSSSASEPVATRPATNTFLGDTGLFFVPTAEVLPAGRASGAGYYINTDRQEAFADIGDFGANFGYGFRRAELFGSVRFWRRIDNDARPLGRLGTPVDYADTDTTFHQGFGDVFVGAKYNFSSQRLDPSKIAAAVRGAVKIPTASNETGTGGVDVLADVIVSKEVNEKFEVTGSGGVTFRANATDIDLPSSLRYGFGVGVPTRKSLRFTGELFGEWYFDDTATFSGPASRGIPPVFDLRSPIETYLGLDYISKKGFFIGGGVRGMLNYNGRSDYNTALATADDESGDAWGVQVRIGYHPGVEIYVPPPPPAPPAPTVAPNRPPTVKARCEPCVVEVGKSATVTADAQDPDGDTLAYKWSCVSGKLANPADRQTLWTAPMQEGTVTCTVTVDDGKGGTASDTVNIQVVRPPRKEYRFEDVHFDFDRYSLRPEATRVLDEAVRALQENPELRIEIEGHTCNIGTAEYNLALGERRSMSVREYLTSRGVSVDRLKTVSYGEERPKYDNAREETRRLNRRAAMVVRVQ